MRRLVVIPQNPGSRSAKALANLLSEKVGHRVFRMSAARCRELRRIGFQLREGTDKLTQFRKFKDADVSCPEFCTDIDTARGWASDTVVMCRTLLRSSEGRGIVVAENPDQVVSAPLYTRYVKKKKEFRVHVLNGQVIDVQEKRKRRDFTDQRDNRIRNLANGYVFCREGMVIPAGLQELAVRATNALGYNLGAVDAAFNEHHGALYVLEVNATPGMQGTTLENYATAIANWYRSQR